MTKTTTRNVPKSCLISQVSELDCIGVDNTNNINEKIISSLTLNFVVTRRPNISYEFSEKLNNKTKCD